MINKKRSRIQAEVEAQREAAARYPAMLAARFAGDAESQHVRRGLSRTVPTDDELTGDRELLVTLLREVRRQGELLDRLARHVGLPCSSPDGPT
ncbi:MAG: hypothetical protein M9894_32150 [Planctomycetes bacterium]|nr:hypothetical protein [Planctomycetota bacterium]